MRRFCFVVLVGIALVAAVGRAQQGSTAGPYKVVKTAKVGGVGGFDYVNADSAGRRLYIARSGNPGPRITVFNLDTLEPVGEVPNFSAHGVAVDPKSNHAVATSKPLVMFDSKTLAMIKTIDVQGNPDGILYDPYNARIYDLSHAAPNATVIDPKDGSIVGTIDLGGMPEQGVTDGKGHLYFDLEDKGSIAAVDANTLKVTATYSLEGKGDGCTGLALDAKNHILFASCRDPQAMVILSADDGKIITTLPIGPGADGAVFNPNTMEAFTSAGGDGTLAVIKENSPTSFVVEQNVTTMPGGNAKTLTLDTKTNRILIIAAEYGPPPPPPPAGAPSGGRGGGRGAARGPIVPDSFSILVVGK
jgi:hypothetical protein